MKTLKCRNKLLPTLLLIKLTIISITILIAVYSFSNRRVHAFASGPPAGYTDAPGEANCTACHTTYDLNTGPGSLRIEGLPETYSTNQEIPITIKMEQLDSIFFGFQLTALDSNGRRAGTLVVTNSDQTQLRNGNVSGNPRTYIEHTQNGIVPVEFDKKEWTFNWIAPDASTGPVTFYIAGNAADGNARPTNDHIYTTSLTVAAQNNPASFDLAVTPDTQTILAGGVASYSVTVSPTSDFTGDVSLSADGLPASSAISFEPQVINTSGSSIMTITTSSETPAGTYNLTITGTIGELQKSVGVSLIIEGNIPVPTVQLQQVVSGFSTPSYVTNAHDGSNRLFILEQPGRINVLQPGETTSQLFLDITSKVLSGGERGLLGLAFHPQFATNRRFFVNYTRRPDGATVIAEYRVSESDPNQAIDEEIVILTIPQPFANHNGGMIEFGADGYLYIAMGDGGSANDPGNRAQNIEELLGKILRIDIDNPSGDNPYSSPTDNPFYGETPGRDEIYALGLRNPWRFSFDRATQQLYVADVGQGQREEINIVNLGGNYGWRVYEGTRCTNLDPELCNVGEYIAPIAEYDHSNGRCSITGGYVYRGTIGTLLPGTYIYADYCTGEIFTLLDGIQNLLLDTDESISSFGEDEAGELYVVSRGGTIFRLVNPTPTPTCATDVTSQLEARFSRFTYRPMLRRSVQTITLTNTGSTDIEGPFSLVLDNLTDGISLIGRTGNTSCTTPAGSPYITLNQPEDNILSPGETISVKVRFKNPERSRIKYQLRVLAGNGER
jgi:glucose/arabinose dehydrogenase